ncbi:MAG: ECF transporter S component [Ruminococcaceae bacterium]|nr:ECF transporter S component [Oscillospiraceae bacterium]
MKKTSHAKILMMVEFAFLAAIEVVLTLINIPIGIGTITLNFGLVPIVVSGIVFGPLVGMTMGIVSGLVTMIQVLTGQGVFYVFLVATNPVVASILCVVKTAAAGLISGLIYNLTSKYSKHKTVAAIAASAACPIVNTGIFALGMLTIFGDALMADPVISTWTTGGLFALVFLGLIGVNFIVELISTIVITPAITKALRAAKLVK